MNINGTKTFDLEQAFSKFWSNSGILTFSFRLRERKSINSPPGCVFRDNSEASVFALSIPPGKKSPAFECRVYAEFTTDSRSKSGLLLFS